MILESSVLFSDDSGSGCSEEVCRVGEGVNITSPVPPRPQPSQVPSMPHLHFTLQPQLEGEGSSSFRLQLGGLVTAHRPGMIKYY